MPHMKVFVLAEPAKVERLVIDVKPFSFYLHCAKSE